MKTIIRYSLSILIVLFITGGQLMANTETEILNGAVSGKVMDEISKKPLEFANIVLINTIDSVVLTSCTSQEDGSFEITKIPAGDYSIKIEFVGYEKIIISNIQINSTQKNIHLQEIKLGSTLTNLS